MRLGTVIIHYKVSATPCAGRVPRPTGTCTLVRCAHQWVNQRLGPTVRVALVESANALARCAACGAQGNPAGMNATPLFG